MIHRGGGGGGQWSHSLEAHLLGALHLPGQAEQQVVGDGVHQVEEGRVLVQDVVQRGAFQAQVLSDQRTDNINILYRLGGVQNYFKLGISVCAWDPTTHRRITYSNNNH